MKIYLIGYGGRTVDELASIVSGQNGVLLDIRFSARSRRPGFSKSQLERRFHEWYIHVPHWGNLNYNSDGPIEIADFDGGYDVIRHIEEYAAGSGWPGDLFLMCACENGATCHRRIVGELLREKGHEVEEWR